MNKYNLFLDSSTYSTQPSMYSTVWPFVLLRRLLKHIRDQLCYASWGSKFIWQQLLSFLRNLFSRFKLILISSIAAWECFASTFLFPFHELALIVIASWKHCILQSLQTFLGSLVDYLREPSCKHTETNILWVESKVENQGWIYLTK